jgi:hypothetical protein
VRTASEGDPDPDVLHWNVGLLDAAERKTLEGLIEKGAGLVEGKFAKDRREADTKQTLAELNRRSMMPARKPCLLPAGTVVLPPDFWEFLLQDGRFLGFEEVAVLGVAAACLENAGSLGPYSRCEQGEDGEPVLVLHQDFGFGTALDPEGRFPNWKRALDQLGRNGWLNVTMDGQEVRVTRGRRLRREVTK